jgi:pyruvate dehydrogenase E1 component alpha subunit
MSVIDVPEIPCVRFLSPEGVMLGDPPTSARKAERLIMLYRGMTLTRAFDKTAVRLQRGGNLGTYASSLGQEAIGVGVAAAMRPNDVLVPSFRDHGAQILRGVTLTELFLFWGGDERGSDFSGPREDFPVAIPVGSQAPHAAGVALALQRKTGKRAAVCLLGDGASSKGDFYEAMNIAGVWSLPVVFVIVNNEWAISVPRARQTAAITLAQKAWAAGFEGQRVDGNDAIAVQHVIAEALAKARANDGPTLVEAMTYRLADHTTADDASRYRDPVEVEARWSDEPLARLRKYLVAQGVWSKEQENELTAACLAQVDEAERAYLATPPQPPEAMFDFLTAALPPDLVAQRNLAMTTGESDA